MEFRTSPTACGALDEISSGGLTVGILRKGAEPVSLRCGGIGYLHRDGELVPPATGWANHATLMGYFLHRLVDGRSLYRGKPVCGGTHGFLRHFDFDEPQRLVDGLVYRVASDRVPADAYPLRVALDLSYRIIGGALRVEFCFTNEEPELVAHVGFGLHPGFAVSRVEDAKILLPPGRYVRHFAPGNFLDGRTEALDFAGGEFPYPKSGLNGSYLLGIEGVPDRRFRIEDSGRSLELDFSEVPYVTFWNDSDRFVCVEPCWGLPDSNPQTAFEDKPGIQHIPPLGQLRRGFSIKPNP